jgi:hypothetical protein
MRWTSPFLVFLTLSLAPGPLARPDPPPSKTLHVGLSDQEVRRRVGPPGKTSRQILLHRSIEQWHYDAPRHLRLTFDCERGRKPTLRHIDPAPRQDR